MPALNGRERAIIFLNDYKAGTRLDPTLTSFLNPGYRREYYRLIDIIRLCNGELTDIVMIIKEQVKQEELRFGWMRTKG